MPEKTKTYKRVIFTPEAIKAAIATLETILPKKHRILTYIRRQIVLSLEEEWSHDTDEEFFADYRKGFMGLSLQRNYGEGRHIFLSVYNYIYGEEYTRIMIRMPSRTNVEKIFNVLESNVEKCRLPKQPQTKSKIKTDWIIENINKVKGRCPIVGRKLELALSKLDSEETEEWQNATMLVRDAWIELTQWLCQVHNIDTSDIPPDAVIDRLKKLKIDKTDERIFNLARASFSLYSKHHKRDIDNDTAIACVVSTIVSMQTVIREVFNARS